METTEVKVIECVCLDVDDSGPEVFSKTWRKARKDHRCCECGETIRPGQTYEYVKGLWDGSWDDFKTCAPCAKIRRDMFTCGYTYGFLKDDLSDHLGLEL